MERIIRVGVVLTIVTLTSLLAIIIANGELSWATAGLVLLIALMVGLVLGVWAVVHNQFQRTAEILITSGIVVGFIIVVVLLLMAGSDIKEACEDMIQVGSAWWLLAPSGGTALISAYFGLHKKGA